MKSTYYLPGLYWDNKPLYTGKFTVEHDTYRYGDPGSPLSLFDMSGKKRQIPLSALFAIDTYQQFVDATIDLRDCTDIGITLDYAPMVSSATHLTFLATRLLQMLGQLHRITPAAELHILIPALDNAMPIGLEYPTLESVA